VLYGRSLRSCILAHLESFSKEWQAWTENCDHRAAAGTEQVKRQYDSHSRSLCQVGRRPACPNSRPDVTPLGQGQSSYGVCRSREYEVHLLNGRVLWRNLQHVHPVPSLSVDPLPHVHVAPCLALENAVNNSPTVSRHSPRLMEKNPVIMVLLA
ncbi:hypothetical protein SK128_017227, partial [Halocaridina rubra]